MVSLLMVIVLSFVVMVRLEMQKTSNRQQRTLAFHNAQIGLEIALGTLQLHAGLDQRVTARADILSEEFSTSPPTLDIRPEHQNWVGVWDSSIRRYIDDPSRNDGALIPNTAFSAYGSDNQKAQPLVWLISDPRLHDPQHSGFLTSDASRTTFIHFTQPAIDIPNDDRVRLYGNTSTPAENRVNAGKVGVYDLNGMRDGDYAWWVADEGIKAKLNVVEPEAQASAAPGTPDYTQRLKAPLRTGIQAMSGLTFTEYDYTDPSFRNQLDKIITLPYAEFLGTGYSDFIEDQFHSITSFSRGLLTDTQNGGLQKDLTAYFDQGAGLNDTDPLFDISRFPDMHLAPDARNLPRWGLLRDWVSLGSGSTPRSMESTEANVSHSFHPVVLNVGIPWSLGLDVSTGTNYLEFRIHPFVVLWNPYNTTMPGQDYTLRFDFTETGGAPNFTIDSVFIDANGTGVLDNIPPPADEDLGAVSIDLQSLNTAPAGYPDSNGHLLLTLPASETQLAPGECVIYSLATDSRLNDGSTTNPFPLQMTRGGWASDYEQNNTFVGFRSGPLTPTVSGNLIANDNSSKNVHNDYDLVGTVNFGLHLGTNDTQSTALQTVVNYRSLGSNRVNNRNLSTGPWAKNGPITWPMRPLVNKTGRWSSGSVTFYGSLRNMTMYSFRAKTIEQPRRSGPAYHPPDIAWGPIDAWGTTDFDLSSDFGSGRIYGVYGGHVGADGIENQLPPTLSHGYFYPIFDVPDGNPLLSLGRLHHTSLGEFSNQPNYAIGNSYVPADMSADHYSGFFDGSLSPTLPANKNEFLDLSYLANEALWDSFYLSTVDAGLATQLHSDYHDFATSNSHLPNSRLDVHTTGSATYRDIALDPEERFDRGAAFLSIDGAFNINSTSVEAWKALLGSFIGLDINGLPAVTVDTDDSDDISLIASIPEPWRDTSGDPQGTYYDALAVTTDTGGQAGNYTGIRGLTAEEIDELAAAIVEDIQLRGPFMGIADFVNRRPVTAGNDRNIEANGRRYWTRFRGVLQSAIDRVSNYGGSTGSINSTFIDSETDPLGNTYNLFERDHIAVNTDGSDRGYVTENVLMGEDVYPTSAGTPGFLEQADLLSVLAPVLRARSDTFKVRSYGRVTTPDGETASEVWLEAVVQRRADYVEGSGTLPPADPWDPSPTVFGRRFYIVSIRELSESEL
jgi:hypothetical protein